MLLLHTWEQAKLPLYQVCHQAEAPADKDDIAEGVRDELGQRELEEEEDKTEEEVVLMNEEIIAAAKVLERHFSRKEISASSYSTLIIRLKRSRVRK